MRAHQRLLTTALFLLLAGAVIVPAVRADAVRLTAPAELDPGAVTATYTGGDETLLPSPYQLTATGNTLTFDLGVPGASFFRFDSNGVNTAFPADTGLIDTNGSYGPVTVSFGQGVSEFGLSVQSTGVDLVYFTLVAYNGATEALSFSTDLIDNTGQRGAPAFLGARAWGNSAITSFTVASTSSDPDFDDFFILGPVSYVNALAQPVPEPATLVLLVTGLAGAAGACRGRRRQKNRSDAGR